MHGFSCILTTVAYIGTLYTTYIPREWGNIIENVHNANSTIKSLLSSSDIVQVY